MPEYIHLSWTADGSPDGPLKHVHRQLDALLHQLSVHELLDHHDAMPLEALRDRIRGQRDWAHDKTVLDQMEAALDGSYHLVVTLGELGELDGPHDLHFQIRGCLRVLRIWFDLGRENAIRARRNGRRTRRPGASGGRCAA